MDDSRDAYTEVGGRATQDAKAEGGGSERLEHVLESRAGTTAWMEEVVNVRNTFSSGDRVNVWNTFSNAIFSPSLKQFPIPQFDFPKLPAQEYLPFR